MHRITLTTSSGRTGEDGSCVFSFDALDKFEDRRVVEVRIIIVDSGGIHAVVANHIIPGDPLAKISFESINTKVEKSF